MVKAPIRDVTGKIIEGATEIEKSRIAYEFIPQAFTKAYCEAWNNLKEDEVKPVFLVIEEINRGNCAQIFGDIFQLLDRETEGAREGFSTYPIDADEDLKKFLQEGLKKDNTPWLVNKDGIKDGKLCLPPNLYIWATMNTSDQSLFPIDSAFKRRWDWKYVPINTQVKPSWRILVNGKKYSWPDFLDKINIEIGETTSSEDKKLGFFFCKADNNDIISAEKFVSKVVFYLWNDVFKDYGFDRKIFEKEAGNTEDKKKKLIAFQDFFDPITGNINEAMVEKFMTNMNMSPDNHLAITISKDGKMTPDQGKTMFEFYLDIIDKIGADVAGPIIESSQYYRMNGCKMATKTKEAGIENSPNYTYELRGEYFFVRGASADTYVNLLKCLKDVMPQDITINFE